MSYVIVHKHPYGTVQISEAVIDMFTADELTVTADPAPPTVFRPGRWREAMQFDVRGNPEVAFQSTLLKDEREAEDARLGLAMAKRFPQQAKE